MVNLVELPAELHLEIVEQLDVLSLIMLSGVNKLFNELCDWKHTSRRDELHDRLCEAQFYARRTQDGYACFSCCKVLSGDCFSGTQARMLVRGLGLHRCCMSCNREKAKVPDWEERD